MTRWERLRERRLPTALVPLPARPGGAGEEFELRALLPERWDQLMAENPATPEQRAQGADWDITTFRPALLAESVVPPNGEESLTAQQWAALLAGGYLTAGEANTLFNTAFLLNSRAQDIMVGKA